MDAAGSNGTPRRGPFQWVALIGSIPLFIVLMVVNIGFVRSHFPNLYQAALVHSSGGSGEDGAFVVFLVSAPLPILVCGLLIWGAKRLDRMIALSIARNGMENKELGPSTAEAFGGAPAKEPGRRRLMMVWLSLAGSFVAIVGLVGYFNMAGIPSGSQYIDAEWKVPEVDEAYRRYKARAIDKAIDAAGKAIARHPDNSAARYVRGRASIASQKYQDAAIDFSAAVGLLPGNYDYVINLDYALYRLDRKDEIPPIWDRYIELVPNDQRAFFERAGARYNIGDATGSREDFLSACKLGMWKSCMEWLDT